MANDYDRPLLEITLDATASPISDWSKVTPRYVTIGFDSMTFPFQTRFEELNFSNLLLGGNKTDFVFPKCKDNSLSVSHSLTDSSS